jgi:hypothetical protein
MRKGRTRSARIISGRSSNKSYSSQASTSIRNWVRRGSNGSNNSATRVVPDIGEDGIASRVASATSLHSSIMSTTPGDSDIGDAASEPGNPPAGWDAITTGKVFTPDRSSRPALTVITETTTEEGVEHHHPPCSDRVHDFIV